ncbi:MAG: 23S rRNA (uracil(1939)-C(5))-methyltransferase RlmD [Clostridium sp.]|nr:23S rRNA (uracil(1939)-C(5))-methyltransferase RlmD [Clostridium sp.]
MGLEKNQEYEMAIEDMGNDGEGIGHIAGMAVFVKDTVPGDVARVKIIKVKKNYAYGRLLELRYPSAYRVEPICPHARQCGGCTIMHVSYEKQLAWKQDKVKNCLQRIGGINDAEEKMEPIIGMENFVCEEGFPAIRYRNKAQFPVRRNKDGGIAIGFYAERTHFVVDTDVCYLQDKVNDELIRRIRRFMEEYGVEPYDEERHTGLVRHILTRVGKKTGEVMLCLVLNGDELIGKTRNSKKSRESKDAGRNTEKLINVEQELVRRVRDIPGIASISININKEKTNRILGDTCRVLWGKDTITDYIGKVKYQISPLSFYQVNPEQTEKLYRKALEYADLQGDETVWDLYCGIGTISLFLAQRAKQVYGVEVIPDAIADARKNAEMNGMNNVQFFVGKAEEVLPEQYEKYGVYADVIVVDPPRKGCDGMALQTMVKMAPKRIVYVSCDPATLARDVKVLVAAGYEVQKICAVDQFGHGGHVESIVLLSKFRAKQKIEVELKMGEMDLTAAESKATYEEIKAF